MFVVVPPIKSILAMFVVALSAFLASCQSVPRGGNVSSKGDITDPNASFLRSAKNAP